MYQQNYNNATSVEDKYSLKVKYEVGDLVLDVWGNICRVIGVTAISFWPANVFLQEMEEIEGGLQTHIPEVI